MKQNQTEKTWKWRFFHKHRQNENETDPDSEMYQIKEKIETLWKIRMKEKWRSYWVGIKMCQEREKWDLECEEEEREGIIGSKCVFVCLWNAILRNDEKEESMCVSCCHIVEVVNLRWSFSFVPTTMLFYVKMSIWIYLVIIWFWNFD